MKKILLIAFLLLFSLTACTKPISPAAVPVSKDSGLLHFLSMNLFEGKEAVYKPFLGPLSGAVRLEYTGTKKNIKSEIEIWENGNKTQTLSVMKTRIPDNVDKFNGTFIASVKEENLGGKNPQYLVTTSLADGNGGYSSSECLIDKDPHFIMQSTFQINNNQDIKDNSSAIVWGIQATDQKEIQTLGSAEETVKKAKWAMAFRISVED